MNKAIFLLSVMSYLPFVSFGQGGGNLNGPEIVSPLRVNAQLSKVRKAPAVCR